MGHQTVNMLDWLLIEHFRSVTLPCLSVLFLLMFGPGVFENYGALRHKWIPWMNITYLVGLLFALWAMVWLTPIEPPKHWVPKPHYVYSLDVRP